MDKIYATTDEIYQWSGKIHATTGDFGQWTEQNHPLTHEIYPLTHEIYQFTHKVAGATGKNYRRSIKKDWRAGKFSNSAAVFIFKPYEKGDCLKEFFRLFPFYDKEVEGDISPPLASRG